MDAELKEILLRYTWPDDADLAISAVDEHFAAKITEKCRSGDFEADHNEADNILLLALTTVGLHKLANVYQNTGRWYS